MRALRELGSPRWRSTPRPTASAVHVRIADEASALGPAPSRDSYLNQERILAAAAARRRRHPSRLRVLVRERLLRAACRERGITFIGPPPEAIELMGNKIAARAAGRRAGAPVVPGSTVRWATGGGLRAAADIGYPVHAEGGGRRRRQGDADARDEAEQDSCRPFPRPAARPPRPSDDDQVYLEKFIERPRHIEIQVLFDGHGHGVHLGERECTIQRRHQKVIEEAPSRGRYRPAPLGHGRRRRWRSRGRSATSTPARWSSSTPPTAPCTSWR